MFEPGGGPRVFGLAPGVDFPRALALGLLERLDRQPPEALARVEVFVNTRRMQRRLTELLQEDGARLLPRIRLVTDLSQEAALADIPAPVSPLRRRLELTQLIAKLLDQQPDLAPRASLFDLADSLALLMDEMHSEGVAPETIRDLDVSDQSGHWQRSLKFVTLVEAFLGAEGGLDPEARQRKAVEHLAHIWETEPPAHPVIVAGSTGSRGATALFMRAVAGLPQGAIVLPGVDFDLPAAVWDELRDAMTGEDHPQFRFARLMHEMGLTPGDIAVWTRAEAAPNPARNRLVSLALRPAPVTDQWMTDGPRLAGIAEATEAVTLIEAPSVRAEASAIALILREAAEQGRTAALITPDRLLTRQVTAALDRWGIIPDDSAGRPLPLTAPGRFLRHVAGLFGRTLTAEALLTLLKHPLTNTGAGDRGAHLLHTRELELKLRRYGPPFPTVADLLEWGAKGDAARQDWARWIAGLAFGLEQVSVRPLAEHLEQHIGIAEGLAAGPEADGSGALWKEAAGEEAAKWIAALRQEAAFGGEISPGDYASLIQAVLQRGEVREAALAHPGIMIWGTLEARVQGADLAILAGLNEGVWPEPPAPDPWLNRAMRHKAGLLLPDRRIGLSAHDFQQAIAAREVILTRAIRDAEAQTVPSRWINRLTNLLTGISAESAEALDAMRRRGGRWLAMAERMDYPETKERPERQQAQRPSPRPPVADRPRELTITEVQRLIRDPYAVYARRILGLRPLDPLQRLPDAPLRGSVLHEVFERFIEEAPVTDADAAHRRLLEIARAVLEAEAPWPAAQRMWRAKLLRVADWFIEGEIARQARLTPIAFERTGALILSDADMTLRGKLDRIDRAADGGLVIYDYKTGKPPTADQQEHFDKQLMLAAVMAERGALDGIDAADVREVVYIGLGASPKLEAHVLEDGDTGRTLAEFLRLCAAYRDPARGYTSRRAVDQTSFGGEYDHLARYGEWDDGDEPVPEDVGA